ncbi:hypothetical protein OPV22_026397 [Ensete ventricosum]|uniref:Uncharacterized protein n=1 Tax=Ensete ventricosum TaxID=4639 RepID=A0AAV8QLI7_ENSVE|nr:hypothetical protein OPV22_026397 [Ensete ventricosum]
MGSFRVMEITLRHAHFCLRCSEHSSPSYPLPTRGSSFHRVRLIARRNLAASVSKSPFPESEIAGEDVLQMFLKDRQLNGDFISKVSDILWSKKNIEFAELETNTLKEDNQYHEEVVETDSNSGFLKLTRTRDWVSGQSIAPANKKEIAKNWQNESEKRKKLNLLKYESIKRELLVLTIGVGAACSVYCLVVLSFQAAFSYASGVLFSCLYLQLLYNHADNLSIEAIPEIFMQKKIKRIGIRSEDLKNVLEKTLSGTAVALSSPRLVIPAAIYGLWAFSQHFPNGYFEFELVPGMQKIVEKTKYWRF